MFGHTYLEGNLLFYFSLCCLVLHDQLVIVQFKARVELISEANKSINLTRGHTILMFNKSSLSSPSLRSPLIWNFLPHPPPQSPPPTDSPLSSVSSSFTGLSNNSSVTFPFPYNHWCPWQIVSFLETPNHYPPPPQPPNISCSRRIYQLSLSLMSPLNFFP